jgi:hypothetical protein
MVLDAAIKRRLSLSELTGNVIRDKRSLLIESVQKVATK